MQNQSCPKAIDQGVSSSPGIGEPGWPSRHGIRRQSQLKEGLGPVGKAERNGAHPYDWPEYLHHREGPKVTWGPIKKPSMWLI